MRPRIKICGLTREQDVDAAIEAGVDAIGFVFYGQSPRCVSPETAQRLARRVPAWVASVGLFVNAPRDEVLRTSDQAGLSHIQLHGDESPEDCAGLGRPVIKAIRVATGLSAVDAGTEASRVQRLVAGYRGACHAVLFDADSQGFGGSGQSFDWSILATALAGAPEFGPTWVLSGGLESGSVGQAIRSLRPPCVDVSSGVELLSDGKPVKGVKDPARIRQFVAAVITSNDET
jgi:phosphoribosylanthranilate isomerase